MLILSLAILLLLPFICFAGEDKPAFRIEPIAVPLVDATIPWMPANNIDWQTGKPVFEIADPTVKDFTAKGWLAATDDDLLIRVDVKDAVHINNQTAGNIWNGDFLRVAVDGKGDGAGNGAADTKGIFGSDDASIGFALTPTGAQGWVYSAGNSTFTDSYPIDLLNFTRDETAKITHYNIRLPWAKLKIQPGAFPQFGITIQVRNVDSQDQREPVQIRWGAGADEPKPGLFKKVAIDNPTHEIIAATTSITDIWENGDDAQFTIAVASKNDVKIQAQTGNEKFSYIVKGGDTFVPQRFTLLYRPDGTKETESVNIKLIPGSGKKAAVKLDADIVIADALVNKFNLRMDELIASTKEPLFLRHLRSVKAMVQTEWARATVYKKSNTALADETLRYIRNILAGFNFKSDKFESYTEGGLPLFMSFVSPRDGTLQWYALTLPKKWDAKTAYPMFFELHGAGNPHYLNHASSQIGRFTAVPGLLGYERSATYEMIQRDGVHVYPFGRGNSGYRDIGETDIWEAYNDAQKTVKIDPDRRYLYGFSMGGGGTWNVGSRSPDQWAAIAVMGMGAPVGAWGQAENVNYLPIYIWGGEADSIAYRGSKTPKEQIAAFAKTIEDAGGKVNASSTPDLGHNYIYSKQEESIKWMQQFTRKRPDKFSFVADTDIHRGVWGITMTRNQEMNGLPKFTCTIDGNTINITTTGTPHIDVQLDNTGLQMTGDVKLNINGVEKFNGPAASTVLKFDIAGK
ncbi:MAG: hypothetical protein WCO98_14435 [bacterium]